MRVAPDFHIADGATVDSSWGLGIAALAVAGGLTRILGNLLALALALVGGLAFALVSATIANIDRFDGLFPVASLIEHLGCRRRRDGAPAAEGLNRHPRGTTDGYTTKICRAT